MASIKLIAAATIALLGGGTYAACIGDPWDVIVVGMFPDHMDDTHYRIYTPFKLAASSKTHHEDTVVNV